MPESEEVERRISVVESGIYLVMRGAEKFDGQQPSELDDDDRVALRDVARGLILVWDGLNG